MEYEAKRLYFAKLGVKFYGEPFLNRRWDLLTPTDRELARAECRGVLNDYIEAAYVRTKEGSKPT